MQGVYDRRVMDQVSLFLSTQVASLLKTDPGRRPTAEHLLLRLNGKRDEVSGSPKPQYQRPVEQDDDDDSDYDTLVQTMHQPTVKPQEKMAPVRSPMSESSSARQQPSSDPPFILVTSTGPAADHGGDLLGLYRNTEQMTEGHSLYIQEHDSKYKGSPYNLSINNGVWVVTSDGNKKLRAATPSDGPTSNKWQYHDRRKNTWHDDPALTVTGLSEKPSECKVTISLSQDIVRTIMDKGEGVAGVYTAGGSYRRGRPVLHHSGGLFILSVPYDCWYVQAGVGGDSYLYSGSAPSQCPADPRAARNERGGRTHWVYDSSQREFIESSGIRRYWSKQRGTTESSGISVKCNKCVK